MKRSLEILSCFIATLSTGVALAQISPAQPEQAPDAIKAAPVAYVYVSSSNPKGVNEVDAFAAAADGKLSAVAGSPFDANVASMAVNGKYLFGAGTGGTDIDSFSIESDGALKKVSLINAQKHSGNCGITGPIFLDHTGATLYDLHFDGNACSNNVYQSFSVQKTSGALEYLGSNGASTWFYTPLSFIGDNVYAYGAVCLGDRYWEMFGFRRQHDGMLTFANVSAAPPVPKAGDFNCPYLTAADPTNHVAVSLQAVNGSTFNPDGHPQLATYTANESGDLTTSSTRENMPETLVANVTDLKMSPSGKLLAVGGTAGLQVFHFNGGDPITHYTNLLTKDEIDQFFWDNDNHLYAISRHAGKLFVFTITPTSVSEAAGSPYAIAQPQNIIVQPWK